MAAAIILIPEMLSGPGRHSAEQQAKAAASGQGNGESTIKTYNIDLSQSPGAQPPMPVEQISKRAPPPEELPPAIATPADEPSSVTQVSPESQAIVSETSAPPARTEAPLPEPPKPEPPRSEPRPVASAPAAPTSAAPTASATGKGWAVQLGSYSSEATARRLASEWRAKGQNAFVMPVTTSGKTLYRVRIGPSKDRAGAEAALKTVKASIPGAAVVAHP